jgi:hypothetical protein
MAPQVTPWTIMQAAEAVIENMPWWDEVERKPTLRMADPNIALHLCSCEGDNKGGQVVIGAGATFWSGANFPQSDTRAKRFGGSSADDPCSGGWAVTLTIEFARCRQRFNVDTRSWQTPEDQRVYAEGLHNDAAAIWQALRAAALEWTAAFQLKVLVDGYGPIQRDLGQCAGYSFTVHSRLRPCPEPEEPTP